MELAMICLDCRNKLRQKDNGEFICTACGQKFILVYVLVRIDTYNPSDYLKRKGDK